MLDPQETVARIVFDHSECASVFQHYRIDFCCHGDISLEAVCHQRNVELTAVLDDLDGALSKRRSEPIADPRLMTTNALVSHIVTNHHEYIRKTLPFIQGLAAKVARVHGSHNPSLEQVDAKVRELIVVLLPHLEYEEQKLFPAILAEHPDRLLVAHELEEMHDDHIVVGRLLEQLRTATEEHLVPDWVCNSYRTLFAELQHFESDLLYHVHLENHVLIPRFMAELPIAESIAAAATQN